MAQAEVKPVIFVIFLPTQKKFWCYHFKFITLLCRNLHCEGLIPSRSSLFPSQFYDLWGVSSITAFFPSLGKTHGRKKRCLKFACQPYSEDFFLFPSHLFLFYWTKQSHWIMASGAVHHSPVPKGLCYSIICTLNGIHCYSQLFLVLYFRSSINRTDNEHKRTQLT